MFNQVTIVGRFTRDPEVTYTKDGTAVCNFTLAVQRSFRNMQGDFDADFVPVTVWRKQAENIALYCHKGALIGVNGRINTRIYENKDQKRVQAVDVNAEQVRFLKLNHNQVPAQKQSALPEEAPLQPSAPPGSEQDQEQLESLVREDGSNQPM